jgi:glycine cleavage system H protein
MEAVMQHVMTRPSVTIIKDCIACILVCLLAIAVLPLLGAVVFVLRPGLIAAAALLVIVGCGLFALSARFRTWLNEESLPEIDYRGLRLDHDARISPHHSWARIYDVVVVGVDDILQAAIGPVDEVELPAEGSRVRCGEPLFVLHHADRRIEVASPISGTVLACNSALRKDPSLINENPFHDGWVVRLQSDMPAEERKTLLSGSRGRAWFRREVDRLFDTLGVSRQDDAAAARQIPASQIHRRLDDDAWRELSSTLRASRSRPA